MAKHIIPVLILLISRLSLWAFPTPTQSSGICDSLQQELSVVRNTVDSIKLLYHLYDLSPRAKQVEWGWQICELAERTHDEAAYMDMLRQLSVIHRNDSALTRLEQMARALPESEEQKECYTFIQIQHLTLQAQNATNAEQRQILARIMKEEKAGRTNELYDNIFQLYALCIYLNNITNGNLYTEYLNRLEELIRQLPAHLYALRNMFYTRSAIAYSNNGEHTKALAADRELLRIIMRLEKKYATMGRHYRDYSVNYYICYRRMLSNYAGLQEWEVKDYYQRIVALSKENEDVNRSLEEEPRPTAYYLMVMKRYTEAIPYIRKVLNYEKISPSTRRQMLALLKDAATVTNNSSILLQTLAEYNELLERYNRENSEELYREMQVRYEVKNLEMQNTELKLLKKESEVANKQKIILIALIALTVAIALLVSVYRLFVRSQRLGKRLFQFTEVLKKERNELKRTQKELTVACEHAESANRAKSEFLHSMSHEVRTPLNAILGFSQLIVKKIPDEARAQLDKFAQIVSINTEYLSTLINDILDISSLESGEMLCEPTPSSVHTMANIAVENMRGRVKPGVTMVFIPSGPDFKVLTDRQRVEQVLINLLNNAAKYTEQGSITLKYHTDRESKRLTFTVTDTGRGIPAGKEEVIFERFVKLDPFAQGSGLGLYICRYIAKMLGGRIYVDTLYRNGACFCFTIPVE